MTLSLQNIYKSYKNEKVITNVSLEIEEGDIYGLVGQNGAGKTTLMRIICGLTKADSGVIELFGEQDLAKHNLLRQKVGSIIETPALHLNLTGEQNLEYYRIQRNIKNKNIIHDLLNKVKLSLNEIEHKLVKNYSLGMKQRLGIAFALLNNPEFIILDEPANGLDPLGIIEMREILRQLNSEGITILVSSHMLSELSQVANKYTIIHHGKVISNITNKELLTNSANLEDYYISLIRGESSD